MWYSTELLAPTLAATLAGMIIGALWYSPLLFMKPWLRLAFKDNPPTDAERKKDMPKAMLGMLIVLLFKVCILGKVLLIMGVSDATTGAQYGLWLGVGFIATSLADSVLFERKPLQLYIINTGYHMVSMTVMGAILGAW
jgi:multidrug transporter EmrE-like cation transporter